jgi:hypothetical protein
MKLTIKYLTQYFKEHLDHAYVLQLTTDAEFVTATVTPARPEGKFGSKAFKRGDLLFFDFYMIDNAKNYRFAQAYGPQDYTFAVVSSSNLRDCFEPFGGIHPIRAKYEDFKILAPINDLLKISRLSESDSSLKSEIGVGKKRKESTSKVASKRSTSTKTGRNNNN